MRFFLPHEDARGNPERTWQDLRELLDERGAWDTGSRKVFRVIWFREHHGLHQLVEEVGKTSSIVNEVVLAIYEARRPPGCYLVCTESRGGSGENPILIGKHQVTNVEDFEL